MTIFLGKFHRSIITEISTSTDMQRIRGRLFLVHLSIVSYKFYRFLLRYLMQIQFGKIQNVACLLTCPPSHSFRYINHFYILSKRLFNTEAAGACIVLQYFNVSRKYQIAKCEIYNDDV